MALALWNFFIEPLRKKWYLSDENQTNTQESHIHSQGPDPSLWCGEVGTVLRDMLEMAGYPENSIGIHTDFFRTSVAPSLGPHPRGTGEPITWKSFMTDDNTPVELSWCWSTSVETPTVRYSVEPIGKLAGQPSDPINTAASVRLLGNALTLAPDLDLYLHRHFQQYLMSQNAPGYFATADIPLSQSFMAFDLLEASVVVKQYYLPGWRALTEQKSKFEIVQDAIGKLPLFGNSMLSSIDVLVTFLESFPPEMRPTVEIIAIDCLNPIQSRLKIYVRCRQTTLKSVIEMLTLGGRAPKTQDEENALRELWCLIFGLDEEKYQDTQPLSENDHLTAGVLYYYEFKAGTTVPKTKVYLPVRHYARDDDQIARGLSKYLDKRSKRLIAGSYYDSVKRLCKHRSLHTGLGFHTYICWASEKSSWNVTAYFNPQAYHTSRGKE